MSKKHDASLVNEGGLAAKKKKKRKTSLIAKGVDREGGARKEGRTVSLGTPMAGDSLVSDGAPRTY